MGCRTADLRSVRDEVRIPAPAWLRQCLATLGIETESLAGYRSPTISANEYAVIDWHISLKPACEPGNSMIKVITFDFYNTLVKFWPPLEDIQASACRKMGLAVPRDAIRRGYAKADIMFNRANEEEPLSLRSPERRLEFFAEYEQAILDTAGVPVTRELARQIWALAIAVPKEFTPFEDTLPALEGLRQRGYRLGVITNLRADLEPLIRKAKLDGCLEFSVNSVQAGKEKPHPPIFQEALRRADVAPEEVLHVGDQVRSDVEGARAMGMQAALLDRGGWHDPVEGCPKISDLGELIGLLESEFGNPPSP